MSDPIKQSLTASFRLFQSFFAHSGLVASGLYPGFRITGYCGSRGSLEVSDIVIRLEHKLWIFVWRQRNIEDDTFWWHHCYTQNNYIISLIGQWQSQKSCVQIRYFEGYTIYSWYWLTVSVSIWHKQVNVLLIPAKMIGLPRVFWHGQTEHPGGGVLQVS